jgi:hypothetical protein
MAEASRFYQGIRISHRIKYLIQPVPKENTSELAIPALATQQSDGRWTNMG